MAAGRPPVHLGSVSGTLCGIAGYSLSGESTIGRTLALQALLAAISERGSDAVGYAHRSPGGPVVVHKQRGGASALLDALDVPGEARQALVHVRDYTKGHPSLAANNHPIRHGAVVGIHNGIIANDEEILTRHGFERAEPGMTVDSEAIFALADEAESRAIKAQDVLGGWIRQRLARPLERAHHHGRGRIRVEAARGELRLVALRGEERLQQERAVPRVPGPRHERAVRATQHPGVGIEADVIAHEGEGGLRLRPEVTSEVGDIPGRPREAVDALEGDVAGSVDVEGRRSHSRAVVGSEREVRRARFCVRQRKVGAVLGADRSRQGRAGDSHHQPDHSGGSGASEGSTAHASAPSGSRPVLRSMLARTILRLAVAR
jgi:hypothetical protein